MSHMGLSHTKREINEIMKLRKITKQCADNQFLIKVTIANNDL